MTVTNVITKMNQRTKSIAFIFPANWFTVSHSRLNLLKLNRQLFYAEEVLSMANRGRVRPGHGFSRPSGLLGMR